MKYGDLKGFDKFTDINKSYSTCIDFFLEKTFIIYFHFSGRLKIKKAKFTLPAFPFKYHINLKMLILGVMLINVFMWYCHTFP